MNDTAEEQSKGALEIEELKTRLDRLQSQTPELAERLRAHLDELDDILNRMGFIARTPIADEE